LITAPYNLALNEEIYAKVVASNFYGDSLQSPAGNGGLTKLVPDSPTNLKNDGSVTSDLAIKFSWSDGASDGGMPILDYKVLYDQG
jgi:hypothetical protein